ncbi:TPA: phosphate--AMP phosphotransferase [Candidatus Latescibacteria bacterium]|nr:phosphate--AMP phosphotransferase [Candidatus Latescibacterota bacterium]
MLSTVDTTRFARKADYKALITDLEYRLGELQREAREIGMPVILVFEGWGAAGKGSQINRLLLALDPRGVRVHSTQAPNDDERMRPFLWRFWTKTPARGRMSIFGRSWYSRFLVEDMDDTITDLTRVPTAAYEDVNAFERQLTDDGCLIIKFFLHISPEEQRKRFKALEGNPSTSWRVTSVDWNKHKQYDAYLDFTSHMLEATSTEHAPWTAVSAEDWRWASLRIFETVIDRLSHRIAAVNRARHQTPEPDPPPLPGEVPDILGQVDLDKSLDRTEYTKLLKKHQSRVRDLEHEIYRQRLPVVIVYEGWDAAGKGGNIKRLARRMDPRGYEVIPIPAPNDVEKSHHYLWRFWREIPKAGHIAIFDRSWYGRVMVERIEGFCTTEEWHRAYREINEMEEHLVNSGAVVLKFWVHIDKEMQLQRFQDRANLEHKQWKITDEDWRNREKWDAYHQAVNEMLYRTDTEYAPWNIIESNDKRFARIKTMQIFCSEIEKRLK